jgi:hypothetical protein
MAAIIGIQPGAGNRDARSRCFNDGLPTLDLVPATGNPP